MFFLFLVEVFSPRFFCSALCHPPPRALLQCLTATLITPGNLESQHFRSCIICSFAATLHLSVWPVRSSCLLASEKLVVIVVIGPYVLRIY